MNTDQRFVSSAALAATTACPLCEHRALSFVLRCDLDYAACLHTLRCDVCSTSFVLVVSDGPPSAGWPGSDGPSLLCDSATRTCVLYSR